MKIYIYQLLALCSFLLAFTSCEEMDSTYEEFVVPGGITYVGKPTNAVAYAGRNRVKLEWARGADPSVTKARVFWNNFRDSVEVSIPSTGDKISVIIDNLPERSYSFVIRTYDIKGNKSVPVELLTGSYAENYQESILSRPLNALIIDDAGNLSVSWGAAYISGGAYQTELKYTDMAGKLKVRRDSVNKAVSDISDMDVKFPFEYRTIYLPAARSIDTFYTPVEQNVQRILYNKVKWTVDSKSSEHPGAGNAADNLIDGSLATRWHTIANGVARYPHHIVIDTKTEKTIGGFELFRHLADLRGPLTFRIEMSKNKVTWQNLGTFNFNVNLGDGQYYPLPSKPKARYFKLTGLTSTPGNLHMVLGELNLYAN